MPLCKTVAPVALLMLTGSLNLTSCAGPKTCDFRFKPNGRPVAKSAGIIGSVAFVCDVRPKTHRMSVWIEKRNAEYEWKRVGYSETSNKIPDMLWDYLKVLIPCKPGVYRIAANAKGISSGENGIPFNFTDWSRETTVIRSECS